MKLCFTFIGLLFTTLLSGQSISKKISLWATYYYVPSLVHNEKGIDLLDENEVKTGIKLDSCDWCKAAIEGTIFVKKDNKNYVLNYAGRSKKLQYDCRNCKRYKTYDGYIKTGKVLWKISSGFGKGVREYKLVPFITIAVDSNMIPFGSVVYIPKAKGVPYTNTEGKIMIHDGYFFTGDTGSKINGNHIDVFIGNAKENPFSFIGSSDNFLFDAYLQSDKALIRKFENLHR